MALQDERKFFKMADVTLTASCRVKLKSSENLKKYLDFSRELKQLCNMKGIVVPIIIRALGIVLKRLLKRF